MDRLRIMSSAGIVAATAVAVSACAAGNTAPAARGTAAPATGSPAGSTVVTSTVSAPSPVAPASTTAAAPATTTSMASPVLGRPRIPRVQRGFGQARPAEISLGGDPTGVVTHVSWHSWGGARAVADGISTDGSSGRTVAELAPSPATVVAFDLGMCRGRRAYRKVEWYFPGHGQHFDPTAAIDICTWNR